MVWKSYYILKTAEKTQNINPGTPHDCLGRGDRVLACRYDFISALNTYDIIRITRVARYSYHSRTKA